MSERGAGDVAHEAPQAGASDPAPATPLAEAARAGAPGDGAFPPIVRRGIARRTHLAAGSVLALMAALLVHAALVESPTVDEYVDVTCGMAFLQTGDARLNVSHPPFGNLAQGIPGALLLDDVDFTASRGWHGAVDPASVARSLFSRDYEGAREALIAGRLMTALLTVLLGVYLYRFCLAFGRRRALLTVALYASFPLFLAHGHLATTDMPVTVASTIAVGEFFRWIHTRRLLRFATFSLAVGIAFATKFSALVLAPALGIVGLVLAIRGVGPWAGGSLFRRLARLGRDLVVTGAVALLVVNAAYLFQRTGWSAERVLAAPESRSWITASYRGELLEELSVLPSLPAWTPIPLPYPYFFGLHTIRAQNEKGHGGWFWGEEEPSRLYFPVLAVIKTPAAVLLLLLGAAALAIRRRRRPRGSWLALAIPPLLLFCLSIFSDIQIGVRHILPIFPFLVVAAGWAATHTWRRLPIAAALALSLLATEAAASAPHFLGHFSWAIGGAKVGHRISMVAEDWGQDLRALARFAAEKRLEPLYYRPIGSLASRELRRYGTAFSGFSCGTRIDRPAWLALHAADYLRWKRDCASISRGATPAWKVNEHIWIFRIEADEPKP